MNTDPSLGPILAQLPPNQSAQLQSAIQSFMASQGQVVPRVNAGPTGQRFRLWNNYYSVVRFQADVSVVSPVTTLTWGVQEQRPFNYRIGDPLTTAGFDAALGKATDAETNLVKANETVAGEQVQILGISLMPSDVTDIGVWKQLISNMSVSVSMDGGAHTYKLGRPSMIPGSGGTSGAGYTVTAVPSLDTSLASDAGFSNGWPTVDNFYPFPEPIVWSPSGETDSNLNILLKLVRQQVIVLTGRAADAENGVAPYTPPTAPSQFGTFIDVMCRLHSVQMGARSVNQ